MPAGRLGRNREASRYPFWQRWRWVLVWFAYARVWIALAKLSLTRNVAQCGRVAWKMREESAGRRTWTASAGLLAGYLAVAAATAATAAAVAAGGTRRPEIALGLIAAAAFAVAIRVTVPVALAVPVRPATRPRAARDGRTASGALRLPRMGAGRLSGQVPQRSRAESPATRLLA
jgi:hypothetical protein